MYALLTFKPVLIPNQDDATPVSVFEFNSQHRRNLLPVAQNAVRRLRVTRHPDILKFMDVVEGDGTIYIMTERVKPLSEELISWDGKPVKDRQDWIIWGLQRITVRNSISQLLARIEWEYACCFVRHGLLFILILSRMPFLLSIPRVMPPTVLFASARYSSPPLVNGSLEGLNSSVILQSRVLLSSCVFIHPTLSILHHIKVPRRMRGI